MTLFDTYLKTAKCTLLILLLLLSISCDRNKKENEQIRSIPIKRFEQDLFAISNYDMEDSLQSLWDKYPDFLPLFGMEVIEIGHPAQIGFAERLLAFTSDFTIYRVSRSIEETFPDLSVYEQELASAFAKYEEVFPDKPIPSLYSCISGFNQSIILADSILAISLDKYLGTDADFYKLLYPPVPAYQRRHMFPAKIPSDAFYAWLVTEFTYNDEKDNLLANIIYEGRAHYCLEQLMPLLPDTLNWGFTNAQMAFCKANEGSMWEHLIENQILFTSDKFRISQFVNPAPFTKDFSQESPGQAANWIGYRIVSNYMKNNKEISLADLMKETDYLKISNHSKYNP